MNGVTTFFLVRDWRIFFSTIVIRSDVEPLGYLRLDFGHASFGMSTRQSDIESLGTWRLYFGNLGSWLIMVLVIPSPWLIM